MDKPLNITFILNLLNIILNTDHFYIECLANSLKRYPIFIHIIIITKRLCTNNQLKACPIRLVKIVQNVCLHMHTMYR